MSKRVVGIGGVFLRPKTDAATLRKWYNDHLGIDAMSPYGTQFLCPQDETDRKMTLTTWSIFDAATDYFPTAQAVMINYRVEDLDRLLTQLREEGVKVDDKSETYAFGKFGWCYDPDGNKIELWQPTIPPATTTMTTTTTTTTTTPTSTGDDVTQATKKQKQSETTAQN